MAGQGEISHDKRDLPRIVLAELFHDGKHGEAGFAFKIEELDHRDSAVFRRGEVVAVIPNQEVGCARGSAVWYAGGRLIASKLHEDDREGHTEHGNGEQPRQLCVGRHG